MDNKVCSIAQLKTVPVEKLKAAYALNMCTVSVSQIIDYNDLYVLEQEYEAILNNLNLEMIPKDDALLKTLTEILNTITFFRIQEIKKKQIEKEYQQRMRNEIWSAIPNLSVVVSGNPIAMAAALATQVGIGYMNYRKEKAGAASDKEKAETELQITAIEQLNALRRELFTSAWKLADKYEFPDCLRLTERQIKQYNNILLDNDEYRKYARLEAVQYDFFAYPPFWYHFAHTALYIATSTKDTVIKETYFGKAKEHFKQFEELNTFNLLREDQLTASADLEYVELLLSDSSPDYEKIKQLIDDAEKKSGNANDVLQICAMTYLRIGESESAARIFKILVNEEYNTIANAKLLSRLYVSQYINSYKEIDKKEAFSNYNILQARVPNPMILYPFPSQQVFIINDKELNNTFVSRQKEFLKKAYRLSLNAFVKKKIIEFNSVIPAPFEFSEDYGTYYSYNIDSKEKRMQDAKTALSVKTADDYIAVLKDCDFKKGYINVLNNTVFELETLPCFRKLRKHDLLIENIEKKIKSSKSVLSNIQKCLETGKFAFEDYKKLVGDCSYNHFTDKFFETITFEMMKSIDDTADLAEIDLLEVELGAFCNEYGLPSPEVYIQKYSKDNEGKKSREVFFKYELLGEKDDDYDLVDLRESILKDIKDNLYNIIIDPNKTEIYTMSDNQFSTYLDNSKLRILKGSAYLLKQKAVAIIDDKTKKDCDLIICTDGVRLVYNNIVRQSVPYKYITYSSEGNRSKLGLGYPDIYSNKNIKIDILSGIISDILKKSNEMLEKPKN